ncbi:MAG: tetratricopeptide repeat protein, partial [Candidatus Eremiobacteraeota bacterium]|nr:tetratricopeptide repeat protein [Candidatus Eremiobacteraeota bacterium]
LDEATATRLLVERARAVRPDFVVNDQNREAVEELCRRLDGIPLCLELAAARLRHLGLLELNASLDDSIELLSGGGPDRPARQQTLANTLDWSFGLLSPSLQQSFLRLAVFRGSFTHQAAGAVGCPRPDLLELADQSLVATRHSLAGESRFALLETVRAYLSERLGDNPEVRLAHARHYLQLAAELEGWRGGRGHAAGLKRLALERANLLQALESLDGPQALELAGLLGWYWEACSLLEEGRRAIESLLSQGESPLALHFLATLMRHQGDYIGAGGHYRRALELWLDAARASETLSGLAQLRFREGDYEAAGELFEQARQQGDIPRQVDALNGLGRVAWVEGRLDEAVELEHQSLQLAQQQEYPLGEAWAHNALGEVHRSRRERAQASRHFRSAADFFTELQEFSLAALALQNLAYVELGQQSWEEAGNGFREALGLWRKAGARHGLALCLIGLAGVLAGQGRDRLGARFLGAADQLLASIGVKLEASDSQDYGEIEARLRGSLGSSLAQVRTENIGLDTLLKELDSHQLEGLEGLTSREVEVLRVTATGVSNKEIAETLSISPQTVMVHLRSIYRKLGVPSRTAAARWASDHGLTPADGV